MSRAASIQVSCDVCRSMLKGMKCSRGQMELSVRILHELFKDNLQVYSSFGQEGIFQCVLDTVLGYVFSGPFA